MHDAVTPNQASARAVTAGGKESAAAEARAAQSRAAESGAETGDSDAPTGESSVALEASAMFGEELPRAQRYADLLTGAGVERGIVGPAEAERVWDRHLLNCGAVARLIPASSSVVDLGSGAGLPGIVLALLLPGASVTLLEPMARRVDFLSECVAELGLVNTTVLRGRAEDLAGHMSVDVVTARAVAPLDRLAGLMLGLMRPGGRALAIKGASAPAELARARPALARLGVSDAKIVHAGVSAAAHSDHSGQSGQGPAGTRSAAAAVSGAPGSANRVAEESVSASAVPSAAAPATTVVMFTAPEHRGSAAQTGRASAHAAGRPGGAAGAGRSTRGPAGGRRSRPNSRRGGG
jgi:16S rRNA (guanine527-N7)-methyltransferase